MHISEDLKEWLNNDKIKNLINESEFKKVFKLAAIKFGSLSYELIQLIDIFTSTNIDPNLKNDLDPVTSVLHKVVGENAIFLGWDYEYDEDAEMFTPYEGEVFTITGIDDLGDVDEATDDDEDVIFNNLLWWITYGKGSDSIETRVYGDSLKLLKPLEELEVKL